MFNFDSPWAQLTATLDQFLNTPNPRKGKEIKVGETPTTPVKGGALNKPALPYPFSEAVN